ncbi:MAG TPA: hypothetical protein VML55_22345 [Planctomycetaceae bacterium]|nr:hypothetical protein [Planctomycetaceae bacterium]
MTSTAAFELFPYRLPKAEFWLFGSFSDGGVGVVRDGDIEQNLHFGPAQFAVLAILVMAAQRTGSDPAGGSPGGPGGPGAFLSVRRLKQELARHADGIVDPEYVVRNVFRARETLASAGAEAGLDGHGWSRMFLESTPLGYRVSLPPENLHLRLLE